MLDLIRSMPGVEAHRLVALTFLSLFRMLRYLALLGSLRHRGRSDDASRSAAPTSCLSVLRSDARALGDYLRQRAGALLAEGFERDLHACARERAPGAQSEPARRPAIT